MLESGAATLAILPALSNFVRLRSNYFLSSVPVELFAASAPLFTPFVAPCAPLLTPFVAPCAPLLTPFHAARLGFGI